MENSNKPASLETGVGIVAEAWVKPEILSFEPIKAAEGINIRPFDGIANLT